MAIVPFWVAVARASSQGGEASSQAGGENLHYATAIIQIPTPAAVAKGVRVQKGKMTLKVLCLTNGAAVSKGTMLMTSTTPPTDLPEDNVMGVVS